MDYREKIHEAWEIRICTRPKKGPCEGKKLWEERVAFVPFEMDFEGKMLEGEETSTRSQGKM